MKDAAFEWDNGKAQANVVKHGVTFEMARAVFADPFAIEWEDDRADAAELRFAVLGRVDDRLLFVAFTMRGEITRIISARRATSVERRRYHEENEP